MYSFSGNCRYSQVLYYSILSTGITPSLVSIFSTHQCFNISHKTQSDDSQHRKNHQKLQTKNQLFEPRIPSLQNKTKLSTNLVVFIAIGTRQGRGVGLIIQILILHPPAFRHCNTTDTLVFVSSDVRKVTDTDLLRFDPPPRL